MRLPLLPGWQVKTVPPWLRLVLGRNTSFTWAPGKTIFLALGLSNKTDIEVTEQHERCHALQAVSSPYLWTLRYITHIVTLVLMLVLTVLTVVVHPAFVFPAILGFPLVAYFEDFPIQQEIEAKAWGLYTRWSLLRFPLEEWHKYTSLRSLYSGRPPYFMLFQNKDNIERRVWTHFQNLVVTHGPSE